MTRILGLFALFVLLAFASGCTVVKPWERDLLARRDAHLEQTSPAAALEGSARPLDAVDRSALQQLGYVEFDEDP